MTTPDENALEVSAGQLATSPTLDQLVSPQDPDWIEYQSDDPQWFLRAAGQVIRQYCGWHLYPNMQVTKTNIQSGSRGIIVLPSKHVTQVDSLYMQHHNANPTLISTSEYVWYPAGWIQREGWAYWAGWYYSGYYYGNDPYYLPGFDTAFMTCTFWHGYETLPDDVKSIAFELAEQAMTLRTGNMKLLEAPGGYRAQSSQNFGVNLNPEQKDRLANYRIGMVT